MRDGLVVGPDRQLRGQIKAASLRGECRFGRAIGRLDWVRHDYMQTEKVEVQERREMEFRDWIGCDVDALGFRVRAKPHY